MSLNYRRFLDLLKKWPLDTTKGGRDLGQHIRDKVKLAFAAGDITEVDEKFCNTQYESLKRLAESQHAKTYARKSSSSSTGLTHDQCNQILSNEFLKTLEEKERGIFSNFFGRKLK